MFRKNVILLLCVFLPLALCGMTGRESVQAACPADRRVRIAVDSVPGRRLSESARKSDAARENSCDDEISLTGSGPTNGVRTRNFRSAANTGENAPEPAAERPSPARETKRGWNVGPFPCVGYTTELGFQYGALIELYDYGDGGIYPGYRHKISAEAAWFTKGSGLYHLFYDSQYLIQGLRLTLAASYIPNRAFEFYGFNGYPAPYDARRDRGFYAIERNMLRITADFQGPLHGRLGWAAGVAYYDYCVGRTTASEYAGRKTLYEHYLDRGIIAAREARGGGHLELKAGIVYDTRDHEADPTRGIWIEGVLYGSPDLIERDGMAYLKLSAALRHYVPLAGEQLTFAYRISYQGLLAGYAPFYTLSTLATLYLRQISYDGLGGAVSVRGTLYDRIVGNGFVWANVELRYRFLYFKLLGQYWYCVLNPFIDAGRVVQPYRLEAMKAAGDEAIYRGSSERLHVTAGIGGKLIMNRNFVLSAEVGFPFDRRDGTSGINLGVNYLF